MCQPGTCTQGSRMVMAQHHPWGRAHGALPAPAQPGCSRDEQTCTEALTAAPCNHTGSLERTLSAKERQLSEAVLHLRGAGSVEYSASSLNTLSDKRLYRCTYTGFSSVYMYLNKYYTNLADPLSNLVIKIKIQCIPLTINCKSFQFALEDKLGRNYPLASTFF